jgi:hypothetical protein
MVLFHLLQPQFTIAEAKAPFNHVLENVIQKENVTRALNYGGIDNLISLVKLTDSAIGTLAYHDHVSTL